MDYDEWSWQKNHRQLRTTLWVRPFLHRAPQGDDAKSHQVLRHPPGHQGRPTGYGLLASLWSSP